MDEKIGSIQRVVEYHETLRKRLFRDKNKPEFRQEVEKLLKEIESLSVITAHPESREILESIFDRWNFYFVSTNQKIEPFEFHENLTSWTNHDIRTVQMIIKDLLRLAGIPEIKGSEILLPEEDLFWEQIINFYGRGYFGAISIKDQGFPAEDLMTELNKMFGQYKSLFVSSKISYFFVVCLYSTDKDFASLKANLQAITTNPNFAERIKSLAASIGVPEIKLRALRLDENVTPGFNEIQQEVKKNYKKIYNEAIDTILEYNSLSPNQLGTTEDLKKKIHGDPNKTDVLIEQAQENLFFGIVSVSLIFRLLENKHGITRENNELYQRFSNIGKTTDQGGTPELLMSAIKFAGQFLDEEDILNVYTQSGSVQGIFELINEEDRGFSEYFRLRGLLAEFWVKELSGLDERFGSLAGLAFYIFFFQDIGLVFLRLFAETQFATFRALVFHDSPPAEKLSFQKKQFEGLTHYQISSQILGHFGLPPVFYFRAAGGPAEYADLELILSLINNVKLWFSSRNGELTFTLKEGWNEQLKENNLKLKATDIESRLGQYVKDNFRKFLKRKNATYHADVYSYLLRNFQTREFLFLPRFKDIRENQLRFSKLTMVKNLMSYLDAGESLDFRNSQQSSFLRLLFGQGPVSRRAFLIFILVSYLKDAKKKVPLLGWIQSELTGSSGLQEAGAEGLREFITLMSGLSDQEYIGTHELKSLTETCRNAGFADLAAYFGILSSILEDKTKIDPQQLNRIGNTHLKNEAEQIVNNRDIDDRQGAQVSLEMINPLVLGTLTTFQLYTGELATATGRS